MQRGLSVLVISVLSGAAACGGTQRTTHRASTMQRLAGVWHAVDLDGKYQLEVESDGAFVQRVTPTGGDDCEQRGHFYWYRGEARSPGRLPGAGPDAPIVVPMPPNRAIWVDVEVNSCVADSVGSRLEVLPAGNIDERLPLHLDRVGLSAPRNYKRFD
ncbi:MAG TPA: hypothetical protein PLF40_27435 [Kofleriaceae bacterium]|nr:hypothetical protein [Kofleriaceae bacterium]